MLPQGSRANARIGNVPNSRTLGGTAVNRAPVGGTASRFVRCSTTCTPASQELGMRWALPAGLCIVDVDRVDADEDGACLDQVRSGVTVEVRRTDGVRGC